MQPARRLPLKISVSSHRLARRSSSGIMPPRGSMSCPAGSRRRDSAVSRPLRWVAVSSSRTRGIPANTLGTRPCIATLLRRSPSGTRSTAPRAVHHRRGLPEGSGNGLPGKGRRLKPRPRTRLLYLLHSREQPPVPADDQDKVQPVEEPVHPDGVNVAEIIQPVRPAALRQIFVLYFQAFPAAEAPLAVAHATPAHIGHDRRNMDETAMADR